MIRILKIICISLCLAVLVVHCSDNSSSIDTEEDTEQYDDGPGYPDNYEQWAQFSDGGRWGPYNVHDPSCLDDREYTYCFSTDVMYGIELQKVGVQVRRSKDLVNWEFYGWAFEDIPDAAHAYVTQANNGQEPTNIWAPYIMKHGDIYRLYYSVSVFGSDASYIGLATSSSLQGPWEQQGAVLKSSFDDPMNAIDPSVIVDKDNGSYWMAYGSFFSGLYMVQLDPETGKPLESGDMGELIARRNADAIEAPELIYHSATDMYYLFVSYGDLADNYNVRVGRSKSPGGPYLDHNGLDMAAETDNYPLLVAPYIFDGHSGWQGTGHVSVFTEGEQYFMMHQGRLGENAAMMVMHLRKLAWTKDGWPVVSPERYGGIEQKQITADSLTGSWEHMSLEAFSSGAAKNESSTIQYFENGNIDGLNATWQLEDKTLIISGDGEEIELYVSYGYDWENNKRTIIYTGLNSEGRSVWGKKVEEL